MPDTDAVDANGPAEQPSALNQLRAMWRDTLANPTPQIDDGIDELITCGVVSIRYAFLTQLLGKLADPARDALSIQRGEAASAVAAGRWDARSFCQANVVPWVSETSQVLGSSPDPYVSNPLRRPRLDAGYEPRRDRELWNKLTATLVLVQENSTPEYTETQLRHCLASLARRYNQLTIQFDVPQRISLDAVSSVVVRYLEEPSGGERPQVVVAALMRAIGQRFNIFDLVHRQSINESDAASASPGDVICYQNGEQVLAVEVKDRTVTLRDVDVAILKARRSGITELLFATASPQVCDPSMSQRAEREFGLGINVYQFSIETLLRALLAIAGEAARVRFLTLAGEELNERVTQPAHKLAWQELLRNIR